MKPEPPVASAETLPASQEAYAATMAPTPSPAGASSSPRAVATGGAPHLSEAGFIGRYPGGKLLGRGGMGEVTLHDDKRIGREVAIKVMRGGHDSADAVARFVREARIQGQLEHPAIVPVHDLGVGEDGVPFFTMKRLRGLTLEQILDGQRRGDPQLVEQHSRRKLLTQFASVCQALEFAHTRGVIHRDLKPTNIMLGDFGEVYLLDWGVAKVSGAAASASAGGGEPEGAAVNDTGAGATAAGSIIGTPGYMAPEQLRGEAEALDARADVYALGAILFEILALEPLHARGPTATLLTSTLIGADARASVRAPAREVPPELEAMCVRATALEPADRYPSVKALLADLERYLDGDRDLERRRAAAADHAASAQATAEAAVRGDDPAARSRAMQEAGRALALDPGNVAALGVVTRLLVEPPRTAPPEVERTIVQSLDASSRLEAAGGMWAYLACFATSPLFLWMGVRNWPLLLSIGALSLILAALAYRVGRTTATTASVYLSVVLNALFLGLITRGFGWFTLLPGMAAATTVAFVMHVHLQRAWITIAIGALSLAVPMLLEWTGVLSPTVRFEHGVIILVPHLTAYPPTATLVAVVVQALALVVAVPVTLLRVRKAQVEAERLMHLQSWQVRQLMPAEAHAAAAPPVPEAQPHACVL